MGEHLNIEWSPIFLWRKTIMKNKLKSVICLLLAMVLAITTVVSTAPTEVQAATYFLQLKNGAKVFCEGMNQGHEIISETGTVTKASRNQFLLKFNRAVRTYLGRLDTDRDDKYDYRMSIFNVYMYEYIQDVGSVVDGAAHKPGFRVVFIIGNGKDDDSAHSMVQNGLVEKAYVYLDDLVNKDMEYGTDVRYVTKDGKVQLYNKSGKPAFGRVHKGFEFETHIVSVRNGVAYYKFTKKMKNRSSGKVKRITALIKIEDTL